MKRHDPPSIVIWTYLSSYSYFIIYGYVGYFRNYLIENIQLWMLQIIKALTKAIQDSSLDDIIKNKIIPKSPVIPHI